MSDLVVIKTAIVSNKHLKQNSSSFGSVESFESFGSMEGDDPLVVLNPNDFTVQEQNLFDRDIDEISKSIEHSISSTYSVVDF